MLYKVTVKRTWTHNNGFRLDPGMSVIVSSTKTSPANLIVAGMQEVSDAFQRTYGIKIPTTIQGFGSNYLEVTKA